MHICCFLTFFFFTDTATTEIYTLSLHDALPISINFQVVEAGFDRHPPAESLTNGLEIYRDRKSTRLNSSHRTISYAVFCLKKKTNHYVHMHIYPDLLQPNNSILVDTHYHAHNLK